MDMLYPMPATTSVRGSSSSSSNSPWMDPAIWSKLPHRLVDRILAFLPPPAFFRARAVCKRWYSLLFSEGFLELHFHLSPHLRWFIFFPTNPKSLTTYVRKDPMQPTNDVTQAFALDPVERTWYHVSFNFIPNSFSPAASSGGLVCWVSDEPAPKTLILCNPLSKSLAQLPPTIRPRLYPTVGLTVGPASLDVVVAGDNLISPFAVKNLTTESFHADSGGFYSLWGTSCDLPRLCSLESGRMVHVDGKFYCMNYSPFSILAYDISSNTWCKIQAPMRRFLRSPSLVECRGRLVLIAAVEKSKLNVPRSVRLWGLQSCGRAWAEVERMPLVLYAQFAEVEGGAGFECVGHGDFIVITIRGADHVLLFDFYRKNWNWVARCPLNPGAGHTSGGLIGFPYEPRLATPAIGLLDPTFQAFSAQ
ncbi:protein UNUSUAL FLORAL ORGANS [Aristolochia californica]|uniref:protein UNUSUAL FLORAL ORGANS n=1 Tax=Aristolochia californica TaxID=171875 RepID=UPI0035DE5CF5